MAAHTIIIFSVAGVLALYLIVTFNGLVLGRNRVDQAWSEIDVQLKRRHDLIPNLVETVKGAMKHEAGTLKKIVEARSKAMAAKSFSGRAKAEGTLSALMGPLLANFENYPRLKANENALALQEELSSTENRIAYTRTHYNASVTHYNTYGQRFPTNLAAAVFRFEARELFKATDAERESVKVSFS